jgi:uncharacterized protein YndB with AHSA1/START domain
MGIAMERKVEFSTLVRAQPDRVYDALATSAGLDGWFTQGSSIDEKAGGQVTFRWKNYGMKNYTGENGGPIIEARRPQRFAFQWKADSGLYMTTVEIDLAPVNQGTAVHLVEYGYEDSPTGTRDFLDRVSGWAQALTLMKFYVEHGVTY